MRIHNLASVGILRNRNFQNWQINELTTILYICNIYDIGMFFAVP